MSEKSLVDAIRHYQKDIERCPENKERMLRCIKRLYVMPVRVEHLQMTGVGRSVNNLREISGEVGDAATALVAKWKAMVTAEDMDRHSEGEDSVADEEEVTQVEATKANGRISPDKLEEEHSIREKENIRVNHRTDKPKIEKSENPPRHSDKHSKENKSSKHSSRIKENERDHSLKKDNSSNKHFSNNNSEKKEKKERQDNLSKSEHKSVSDKEKVKHKDDKYYKKDKSSEKHTSKEKDSKDKHSDKHSTKEKESKDKHSAKHSSKDREKHHASSSKDKDKKERSKDDREKIKKEKRSDSPEKDSRKRKHKSKDREETPAKKTKHIKREKLSSDEEEDEEQYSMERSGSEGRSDNSSRQISDESDRSGASETNDSLDESDSESFSRVRVKQEPVSDSESEQESKRRPSDRETHRSGKKTSEQKERRSDEMKPPSKSDLKALIKENEKKIKKEKTEELNDKKKSKTKIEMNQDGSIDSGSGASFADALMGFDSDRPENKKKKKKRNDGGSGGEGSCKTNAVSSAGSGSGHSRSPSVCSTASSLTASPSKHSRKHAAPSSHHDSPTETPEALLKKPIKLEPLSLDISSTLPEISTNYKPLPSIPARHTPLQTMSEEQMFSHMTSKNQRTKVYSGYKYGHTATVPSLYSFCIQVLFDNIDGLEYTGGVPFEILKPLLIKLNAEQLLNLEHYNPYLVVDTDDLWKFHCNKTFVRAKREDMETWRETYLRCMDERELKLKRLTANISESMAKSGPARQAKLAYVDTVAKPPRSIARKQAKYGTGSGSSPVASTSSGPSISQIAAAQNQAKKKEIVSKAIVGGFTPATQATEQVPAASFNNPVAAAKILKKKKAPLMAKALQLIKSNSRYKR